MRAVEADAYLDDDAMSVQNSMLHLHLRYQFKGACQIDWQGL